GERADQRDPEGAIADLNADVGTNGRKQEREAKQRQDLADDRATLGDADARAVAAVLSGLGVVHHELLRGGGWVSPAEYREERPGAGAAPKRRMCVGAPHACASDSRR